MNYTPQPVSLAAALALPRIPGRSAEVFIDGDLEVRFAARPTNGPQIPHLRDELYFVAAGYGRYCVEDKVTDVGPGDLLFCAAHVAHGFEDISDDFCVWVLFYGRKKQHIDLSHGLAATTRKGLEGRPDRVTRRLTTNYPTSPHPRLLLQLSPVPPD